MLNFPFLNNMIHFTATLKPIHNNQSMEKGYNFTHLYRTKRELCEDGGEKDELWIQGRSFPPLQQVHLNKITPNPKATTNKIKSSKTKLFHEFPWMLYEKTKMEQREEEEMSFHATLGTTQRTTR